MNFLTNKKQNQAGFAALLGTLIVMSALTVITGSLSLATLAQQRIAQNLIKSAQAYYSSESGIEDSLYRIIKGKNYFASNSLAVASSIANINISGTSSQKIIHVQGEQSERFRSLETILAVNDNAVSFHYGVQVGEGGLTMDNNSQVTGSVYSNGPIIGSNGAVITGDTWVASTPSTADQAWTATTTDFIFGQSGNQIDPAQSFQPSISGPLTKISLYLKKVGLPGDRTVRILTDNNGQPSKNLVSAGASGTLSASQVSQNAYGWINIFLTTPPNLSAGGHYWIVVDASADSGKYFLWSKDATDGYINGTGQYSPNWNASSPLWYNVNGDLAFKAWLGGDANPLSNTHVNGDAHASTITNCTVDGNAYYQTISNSTVNGTQYPDSPEPNAENMPISDQNIVDWKTEAAVGGTISSYTLANGATGSLGPKKINGDLIVANNADLTVTGTLYVTGNITLANGAKLRLGSNYGALSGVVITDGIISVSNNSIFYTNGAGTYLLMLSTNTGIAINVSNNANTVIFYASNGTVNISNNATLKEVTAYKIDLSNGVEIVYESGLASAKFSSGSGGTWRIVSWQEVP